MAEGEYLEIYSQYMEEKGNQAQASIRFLLAMEEYDWAKKGLMDQDNQENRLQNFCKNRTGELTCPVSYAIL